MTNADAPRKLRQDSLCLKTTDAEFLYSLVVNLADNPEDKMASLWESEILTLVTTYITGERGLKSSVIPVNTHFNELVASFRNADVFGDCPVALTNYLYSPVEAALQWSEKHVLIQDLVLAARAGEYAPIAGGPTLH